MKYNSAMRKKIGDEMKGKTVKSLEYSSAIGQPEYWVMTFTDGSEISFRFMAQEQAE